MRLMSALRLTQRRWHHRWCLGHSTACQQMRNFWPATGLMCLCNNTACSSTPFICVLHAFVHMVVRYVNRSNASVLSPTEAASRMSTQSLLAATTSASNSQ